MTWSCMYLFMILYRARLSDSKLYEINPIYFGLDSPKFNYECYDALATKADGAELLLRTCRGHQSCSL